MGQFHFDPNTYLELMHQEVPSYERLQAEVVDATLGLGSGRGHPAGEGVDRILELGTGTGETARRVLKNHLGARLVGIDSGEAMLEVAKQRLPGHDLRLARLEDPLPDGPFNLVFSCLTVHHLGGPGKADLFRRVAAVLAPGARFVLGDVVVPEDPANVVTPIDDGDYDKPSRVDEQLKWLREAGFEPRVVWAERDLAVIAADLKSRALQV